MSTAGILQHPKQPRSAMSLHDIIVYSSDEHPVLVVQVKPGKDDAPEQLERFRRSLEADVTSQNALFLLLVQRNGLFLWAKDAPPGTSAQFAPVQNILREYAASVADQAESFRKSEIEMVIHSWLDDLALGIRMPKTDVLADQLLVKAGVYDRIRHGRVVAEP